jgi:hypothetical protein
MTDIKEEKTPFYGSLWPGFPNLDYINSFKIPNMNKDYNIAYITGRKTT